MVTLRSIGSDVNKGLPPSVLPLLDEAELGGGVMAESRGPCGTTGDCLEQLAKFGGPYGTTDLQTVVTLKSIGSEVNRDLLPPVLLLLDEGELGGDVMAKFRGPCSTTGDPLEGEDLLK